jgi:dephospho-CoA kinase
MLKVALTGGIATGKSYVLDQFRRRGVASLDADALAHGVTSAGTEATRQIAARFGQDVTHPDGSIDRTKLGAIVFADPNARRELEAIVHPGVYRAIAAGLIAFERLGSPLAVVDVPLLYETGRASDFDAVIVTACSPDVQRERLVTRGLSATDAERRIASQWPIDEKVRRADYIIRTDGSFEDTDRCVEEVLGALRTGSGGIGRVIK